MSCVCHAFASVHCFLVVTWRENADLLALVCDVYCDFVTVPFCILGQVWYLIVSIPDLSCLSCFNWPSGNRDEDVCKCCRTDKQTPEGLVYYKLTHEPSAQVTSMQRAGADPWILEREFIFIKVLGFALLILSQFFFKCSMKIKNWSQWRPNYFIFIGYLKTGGAQVNPLSPVWIRHWRVKLENTIQKPTAVLHWRMEENCTEHDDLRIWVVDLSIFLELQLNMTEVMSLRKANLRISSNSLPASDNFCHLINIFAGRFRP